MNDKPAREPPSFMTLRARTAADLMVPNPVSIRHVASVQEAVALLTDKGFSAAPVIDEAGRPIGVLSRTDLLVHERERTGAQLSAVPGKIARIDSPSTPTPDLSSVRDLMTPVVFSVAPDAPARTVVAEMVALNVHRLFVIDRSGVLVGVVTALGVLRHLGP